MRKRHLLATVFGLLIASAITTQIATAQATATGAPAAQGTRIAIVDVARILKDHPGIQAQMKQIETELASFDAAIKAKQEEINNELAVLKGLVAGSPDYIKQEEKIAQLESRGKLDFGRKRKELVDGEAQLFYDNYQLISQFVSEIAVNSGVSIVFRYNSEDMDLENKDSLIRGVMKNIVYYNKSLDMTDYVMQMLDRHFQQTAAAGAAPRR